ncbi:TPA: hypothetical protein MG739_25250 [Klebsiella pneumoniae]|uniref:EexN family lipoprotein n=1 Tax=Klebsiella pneumoniae TaxID=573 RepID=A0A3G4RJA2_KLEPN|nr:MULTISPECIES: EexN family lipoprotein [Klebsiella]AXO74111.1 hypothetical protein BC497_29485 [Klebsiella variicola]AYU65740.1 hypothetical protein [Klebsiella pneumoniae]MBC4425491.1 EexN family lipoprotein [Klebsiella variicola]MBK2797265.1 hypothetical protein [Klebsiella pneumoniae]MCC4959776.1 EexN family lipoprotein [Klebsiella pneumoniae]
MKKLIIALGLVAGSFALAGCGDETHDIPYFKAHQDEMKQVLEECGKQSMDTWSDNCKNAQEADHQIKSDKLFAPSKK